MKVILLAAIFFSVPAAAELKVRVNTGPVRFNDAKSTTTTTTTIVGPGGERRIRTDESGHVRELPTTTTIDTESHTEVQGVKDPGLQIERKTYYFGGPGQQPMVISSPVVTGGPGSINTKSSSKSTQLPKVDVEVR